MLRRFRPYLAAFTFGISENFRYCRELIATFLIYNVLLVIFYHIFALMPIEDFHAEGLTHARLFWYFAITETVIVSCPSMSMFGRYISSGRLTDLMLRPARLFPFFLSLQMGMHLFHALLIVLYSLVVLPLFAHSPFPLPLKDVPALAFMIALGCLLMETFGYVLCWSEVFGPYSSPANWIGSKLIFVFGGLFMPICYFPPLMRSISEWTPFSATIYSPASLMLPEGTGSILHELGRQGLWTALLLAFTWWVDEKMKQHVLEKGFL